MTRARSFLEYPADKRLLLTTAGILFTVFSVTLRVGSIKTNETLARRLADAGLARWSLENTDWAVSVVESARPGLGGCLPAAIVGLAICETPLELQLGVRDGRSSIEAHAWLESADGRLLYAGEDPRVFHRLDRE